MKKITTATYALGLGTVLSAIYAFYTGTLGVIWNLASTNYQAFVFIVGFGAIISVPLYEMVTGKRVIDVSKRNLLIILIVVLLVQPYVIQGQYNPDDLALYDDADTLIADHATLFYYYNTSGSQIAGGSQVETAAGNGTWTLDLSTTAQDNDLSTQLRVYWSESLTVHDTINSTAFDQDTTDHIVAVGIRITGGTNGIPIKWYMGFQTEPDYFHSVEDPALVTSDSIMTMYYFTASDYKYIDDYETQLAAEYFRISFREEDANVFVNGADIEIEIHFYTETSMATFSEYMLYCGIINLLVAAAMTRYWNPTGYKRRRF